MLSVIGAQGARAREKKRDLGTNLLSPTTRDVAPPSPYCYKSAEPKQIGIGLNVTFERTLGFSPKVYFPKWFVPKMYFLELEVYFPKNIFKNISSNSVYMKCSVSQEA